MVTPSRDAVLTAPPLERVGPRLGGVALDGAPPFVSSGGARVLAEAVMYRVFKAIPRIIDPQSYVKANELLLSPAMLRDFVYPSQPWDTWTWLKSIANNRRRKLLVKAWVDYTLRGSFHPKIEDNTPFGKTELLAGFAQTSAGPDVQRKTYVPRLIQAPHDETHLIAGPYLKPLVQRLKDVWNYENWLFYASVSPNKLNKWLARVSGSVSFFWSDYSAFDATWSQMSWDLIERCYHMIYPDMPDQLKYILDIWRAPHGVYRSRKEDVRIEYQADVCNASGRDDTALANAMLNGIVLALSFAAACNGVGIAGVTDEMLQRMRNLVSIAVVGDDSLVACSFDVEPLVPMLCRNIESFGLNVTCDCSRSVDDVTFLGMMPYRNAGSYFWGPTIGRRLYKAYWQCDPKGNLPAWTRGVAQQMMQYRNVPFIYDIARRVDSLLAGHKVTKVQYDENRVWTMIDETMPLWDHSTLDGLVARYGRHGVTRAQLVRDLQLIERIERLPCVIHLETLDLIVNVDDL